MMTLTESHAEPIPVLKTQKEQDSEPIPGYRLIDPLGGGGFGEVWRCEAPGGLFKAIKFVRGNLDHALDVESSEVRQELKALHLIKGIRHPFILPIDRIDILNGELVIVMELADKSLEDLRIEYRDMGQPGIPTMELLGYLSEAAEALDVLNIQYGLQHLDIKPRNLFLISNHVKIADFGLVNSLQAAPQQSPSAQAGGLTPLYAAPERFLGSMSASCDQYSLAVVYYELLTGRLPFTGKNYLHLFLEHTQKDPDLTLIPEGQRPALAKALAKDPRQRFSSSMDFMNALVEGTEELTPQARRTRRVRATFVGSSQPGADQKDLRGSCPLVPKYLTQPGESNSYQGGQKSRAPDSEERLTNGAGDNEGDGASTPTLLSSTWEGSRPPVPIDSTDSLNQILLDMVQTAVGPSEIHQLGGCRYRIQPGEELEHQCWALLHPGREQLIIDGFCKSWNAKVARHSKDIYHFQVPMPGSFWQRWLGRPTGLTMLVRLTRPPNPGEMMTHVSLKIIPSGHEGTQAALHLQEFGPILLAGFRYYLKPSPERRSQERLPYEQSVQVFPVVSRGELGPVIEGRTKDISLNGMKLWLPREPGTSQLCITLATASKVASVAGLARVMRVEPSEGDGYDIGVLFSAPSHHFHTATMARSEVAVQ